MAYLPTDPNLVKDDEDKEKGSQGPVLGAPGATPIQGTGGGGQAPQAGAAPKPSKSGAFTNLLSYVGANKGNDGAMAGDIGGNVANQATAADTAGSTFKTNATTAIEKNTVRDDGTVAKVKALPTSPAPVPPVRTATEPPVPAPTPAAPIDGKQFTTQYNANYTGPNSAVDVGGFAETGAAYGKVDNLGRMAGGDLSDRGVLLDDVYGKNGNQYRSGERKLDSFILGAGEQGQETLKNVANLYGNYSDNFEGIKNYIGTRTAGEEAGTGLVGGAIDTTKQTRLDTRGAVDTAKTGFGEIFDPLKKQAQTQTDASKVGYEQLTKGDRAALEKQGIDFGTYQFLSSLPGFNFKSIVDGPQAYGLGDLANDGTESSYTELLGLLGGAGANAESTYEFKTGGKEAGIDQSLVKDATTLSKDVGGKINTANTKRLMADSEWNTVSSDPAAFLSRNPEKLGLTQAQADWIIKWSGMDVASLFRKAPTPTLGDSLSPAQQEQLTGLFGRLGLDPAPLTPSGNTGSKGYVFDLARVASIFQPMTIDVGNIGPITDPVLSGVSGNYGNTGGVGGVVVSDKRKKTDIRDTEWAEIKNFLKS